MAQIVEKFVNAVHNLQGTIYKPYDDGTYIYHCHALPSGAPLTSEPKWMVWRENKASGELAAPTVGGLVVVDFKHAVNSVTTLTYHDPGTIA